ncbi:MAG: TlpA family protein disulfide reductase [Jatrophihabitans sp.]|uniref:TlpA family protein disulfide reductase n=1 Tax=Jatrophihabitans sp. TaxID=1932789 RepID=UPI003F7F115F
MKAVRACLLTVLCAVLSLTACTGSNAVDQTAGGDFRFVTLNPVGKTIPEGSRKKAADISGTLLDGGTYQLSEAAGKVVVLNFWASWCGPCQVESPQYDLMYRQNRDKGITFVGIDIKDDKSSAQSFVHDFKITYPILYDEPGRTALELGHLPTGGLPVTMVLDKQHRVAAVYAQKLTAGDLQPVLDRLAQEQ